MKNIVITKGTRDSTEMILIGLFTVAMLLVGFIYGR